VTNESGNSSYIDTFKECVRLHRHPDDHMEDPELDADDVGEFENQELGDQVMQTESPACLQTGQRLIFDAVVQTLSADSIR
jgi:hypothetical protein